MAINCVGNLIQGQSVKSSTFGNAEKTNNNINKETNSFGIGKTALTLATLGAITYGIIKYRNAKALKPLVKSIETATKNGGKLINQVTKNTVKNPDGTTTTQIVKSVKSHFDKNGVKRAEIIHNYEARECYSTFYDEQGDVIKNVVSRMSEATNNRRYFVNQKITHTMSYTNNSVTTKSTLRDFTGKNRPEILYTNTKTEPLKNNILPIKVEN